MRLVYTCFSGGDIRLNFLIKTASSSRIYLTPEQTVQQKPNSRIVYIGDNHARNSLGIPFLVYCSTSELKLDKNVLKVCLHNGIWHTISSDGKRPYLVGPAPSIHNYDIDDNPIDEQSASEEEDPINQTIRNSPIQTAPQLHSETSKGISISVTNPNQSGQTVATVKSTTSTKPPVQQTIQQITSQLAKMTTTQTAQTTTTTQNMPTTSQTTIAAAAASTVPPAPTASAQQISDAFQMGLKCVPGGGGGGGGGGG